MARSSQQSARTPIMMTMTRYEWTRLQKHILGNVAALVNNSELLLHNSATWLDNPAAKSVTQYTDLVQSFTGFLYPENATRHNLRTIVETFHNWTIEMAPYVTADVELWTGKISDIPPEATAFPHRGAVYNLGVIFNVPKDRPARFASRTQCLSRRWYQIGRFLNGAYVNYQMASLGSNAYSETAHFKSRFKLGGVQIRFGVSCQTDSTSRSDQYS